MKLQVASTSLTNCGRMNSYSLRVLQENQCALIVKALSQTTEHMTLADTIRNTKLIKKKD